MRIPERKYISLLLIILFFAGLGGMFLPAYLHELLGCIFLAALVLHNAGNIGFYRTLKKGPFHGKRLANAVCIALLILCIPVLAVSGMVLADWLPHEVISAYPVNWRSLHLGSSVAALILLFFHGMIQAKRYVRGRLFYGLSILSFLLAAGGIFGMPYLDRWYHRVYVDSASLLAGEQVRFNGRVLTVYFSRVGNTNFPPDVDAVSGASVMKDGDTLIGNAQMIALMVQSAAGSDLLPLRTEKTYPADYGKTTEEGKQELESGKYSAFKPPLPDLDGYDTVILVYPLWWGTLPMAVEGFLHETDLSGKMLIPIVTHGGGGAGESLERIRQLTRAKVTEPLSVYSSDIPSARNDIVEYLREIRKP